MDNQAKKYLPLTEATYYILVSLIEPLHGYGIMQIVEKISNQAVRLGPGTLYGALSKLEKEGLIIKVDEQKERRKAYILTALGKEVVKAEFLRLRELVKSTESIIERMEGN